MSGTALRKIKLYAAHLAAQFFFYIKLKSLSGAGQVFMTENIRGAALSALTCISAVFVAHTL